MTRWQVRCESQREYIVYAPSSLEASALVRSVDKTPIADIIEAGSWTNGVECIPPEELKAVMSTLVEGNILSSTHPSRRKSHA